MMASYELHVSPFEPGGALVGQGGQRLEVVGGPEGGHLVGLGEVERRARRRLDPGVDGGLGALDGERGAGRQPVGEGERLVVQVVVGHRPVGEPEPHRLGGRHGIAGEQEPLGQHGAQCERPGDGAAVAGDQADRHVRVADPGRLGHEAPRRSSSAIEAPRPMAWPFTRGDDRQVDVEQVPDHGLGVEARARSRAAGSCRVGNQPKSPPAENARPRPVSSTARRRALGLEAGEQGGEVRVQVVVDRVDRRRRVVDGDDEDVAVAGEVDGGELVGHAALLGLGLAGRPSSCSAMMLDSTSVVPPPMVSARLNR